MVVADLISKEQKMLESAGETIGSALGSVTAKAVNVAAKILPSAKTRRRAVKDAKAAIRKTRKLASRAVSKGKRRSKAGLRKAARKVRAVRRSLR
jgi:hypothetical protein